MFCKLPQKISSSSIIQIDSNYAQIDLSEFKNTPEDYSNHITFSQPLSLHLMLENCVSK